MKNRAKEKVYYYDDLVNDLGILYFIVLGIFIWIEYVNKKWVVKQLKRALRYIINYPFSTAIKIAILYIAIWPYAHTNFYDGFIVIFWTAPIILVGFYLVEVGKRLFKMLKRS